MKTLDQIKDTAAYIVRSITFEGRAIASLNLRGNLDIEVTYRNGETEMLTDQTDNYWFDLFTNYFYEAL